MIPDEDLPADTLGGDAAPVTATSADPVASEPSLTEAAAEASLEVSPEAGSQARPEASPAVGAEAATPTPEPPPPPAPNPEPRRGFAIPAGLTDPRALAAAVTANVQENHDAGVIDDETFETLVAVAAAIENLAEVQVGLSQAVATGIDVENAILRRIEAVEAVTAAKPPSVAAGANLLDAGDIDGAARLLGAAVKELTELRGAGAVPARTAAVLENLAFAIAALGGVDLKGSAS